MFLTIAMRHFTVNLTAARLVEEVPAVVLAVAKPLLPDALPGPGTTHAVVRREAAPILQVVFVWGRRVAQVGAVRLVLIARTVGITVAAPRLRDADARVHARVLSCTAHVGAGMRLFVAVALMLGTRGRQVVVGHRQAPATSAFLHRAAATKVGCDVGV